MEYNLWYYILSLLNTIQQAWENIENIADAIDVVVALVDSNQMSDETGKAATVDYLLKVFYCLLLFLLLKENEFINLQRY